MTHRADVGRGRDIVARWCNLAEQRLEHLTELFETGRWRRYHSEQAFLENIQEARAAVEIWRSLEMREASLDNTAVDLAWLGRPRSTLPRSDSFLRPFNGFSRRRRKFRQSRCRAMSSGIFWPRWKAYSGVRLRLRPYLTRRGWTICRQPRSISR